MAEPPGERRSGRHLEGAITNHVRALLFDFDGLLVDTESPAFACWQEVYAGHGLELPVERWALCLGTIGGFDPVADLESLAGRSLDREELHRLSHHRTMQMIEVETLRPGVREYLDGARARDIRTAIVTSSSREWVGEHLGRVGATEGWDTIRAAEGDASIAKPSPHLYLAALDDLRVGPREAVVFEDSPNGIRAAKRAGIFCVVVPNTVTAQLDLSEADLRVESLAGLPLDELLAIVPAA